MISIIIATFNAELELQKTIDSIRWQLFKNYELIIIDGYSSDNTVNIIKSNSDIVSFYVSEPDLGLYDAWNKGIKVAKGEWICFLGAGDTLNSDALQRYYNLILNINSKIDYISAKINRVDENGQILTTSGQKWIWSEFKKNMTVAHVGSLHSKTLFLENGYFDLNYKICADYELLLRKKSELKCLFLDYVIGNMPIGGVSFSTNALFESAKAKKLTAQESWHRVIFQFIIQFFLFKTFKIRHKINKK